MEIRLLGEEADGGVSSRREDPWLGGVKGHIQDTEVMSDHVTSEDLHGHNQRVLQQVTEETGVRWGETGVRWGGDG